MTRNINRVDVISTMQSGSNGMTGKLCLVTGGTSGIGKATALGLAKLNASVVIVGRDKERGESALKEISSKSGNQNVNLMLADFSSQQSIRQLAQEFKSSYEHLSVLVNNAGVFMLRRSVTVDGFEKTFEVNYLAPFLLTNLLLDLLKKSAPSRIVNVASASHYGGKIHFDDIQGEKHFSGFRAYGQSKLANVLFTYNLARRLEGSGVTVNCLHPSFVRTNVARDNGPLIHFFHKLSGIFAVSPEKGAETVIYLSSSPEVSGVTGKYFTDKKEVRSSNESYDEETARRLWQLSEELTGLSITKATFG